MRWMTPITGQSLPQLESLHKSMANARLSRGIQLTAHGAAVLVEQHPKVRADVMAGFGRYMPGAQPQKTRASTSRATTPNLRIVTVLFTGNFASHGAGVSPPGVFKPTVATG
jgi:hypothetical protein